MSLRLFFLVCVVAMVAVGCSCGDDDDDNDAGADDDATDDDTVDDDEADDDADDDSVDDDSADDDTSDDDTVDDDTADDDTADDDTIDDDTADDDTADIYADLEPTGVVLSEAFGISSHMAGGLAPNSLRDLETDHLEEMGVMQIRRDFIWSDIEPANDTWNWDQPDGFYQEAVDHDFQFDALLAYGNPWAMPGGSPSEINPADWADFAGQVAARYCDRIKRYEIWNEENASRFWTPEPDPDHYGLLLEAAYDAVKTECPDAEVIFGGLSPWAELEVWKGVYPFFGEVADAHPDICDSFDVMAIHPYTFAQQPAPEFDVSMLFITLPDILGQVDEIRGKMDDAGCGDKPLLWTEFGWPSYLIGRPTQAQYLARGILLGAKAGVSGFYWYTFWDGSGGAWPPTEDYFGLFYYPPENNEPKPDYYAYLGLINLVGDLRYAGDLSPALELPEDIYALAFADEDLSRIVVATWDGREPGNTTEYDLPFPAGATSATVYNLEGEVVTVATNDPIQLLVQGRVMYVEFLR